jgi:hypothetical protein
MQEMTQR